jgi:hypothetical protein
MIAPMGPNRVFFPQEALDQWLGDNRVELVDNQLVIKAEGRKYKIVEALHVLGEVTGTEDANELNGKVKTLNFLTELGAEILGSSMIIGDNAYDVVPGWLGSPVGTFADHRAEVPSTDPRASISGEAPKSEEELLAQYLMQALE